MESAISRNNRSDLLAMLEEHCDLLRERGYEELGLGSLDEPGVFLQQLEQSFSHHIHELQFKKSIQEFDVRGIGFFNEEKNMIDFSFHYELDPERSRIELKSFTAAMDGVTKRIILEHGMYKLPSVETVVSILERGKEMAEPQLTFNEESKGQEDHSLRIKEMLTDHCTILVDNGYANKEHFPYADNFLFKKMEHKLKHKYVAETPAPDFLIRIQGFFNEGNDEVKYNFFYSMDCARHVLQMNTLVAELNDKRICYSINNASDLPPASKVWLHLTSALKEENVQVIIPKEKVMLQLREQERLLGALRYYKTIFDNNSNFIDRELRGLLENSLNERGKQIIPINRRVHLNLHDTMHCRFQYSFDPIQIELMLDSVTANVGIVERTYTNLEIQNQKLKLQDIFDELNQQNRLLNARRISEGPPDRTGMKSMLKHLQKRSH